MIPPPPTGPLKLVYILGVLASCAGVAIGMFAIVTTVAEGFRTFDEAGPGPIGPDFERIGRLLPIAFGLAVPGGILTGLASAIGPHPPSGNQIHVGRGVLNTGDGNVHLRDSLNDSTVINAYISRIALGELQSIRDVVSGLRLPAKAGREIAAYLDDAERGLSQDQPDADWVGDSLTRATTLMRQAGAFAQAGGELVPRLTHLASLLGTAGHGVLRLLA